MGTVSSVIRRPVVMRAINDYIDSTASGSLEKTSDLADVILSALDAMPPIKNVILSEFLRIGDRVVMNMNAESRGWTKEIVPNGTTGTVIGVYRYQDYRPRYGNGGDVPGIYESDGVHWIEWDDITKPEGVSLEDFQRGSPQDIAMIDQTLQAERYEEYHSLPNDYRVRQDIANHVIRVGDLPETKFWELDRVVITRPGREKESGYISRILYRDQNDRGMCYDVQMDEGGSTWLHDCDLDLIVRGNVWRHFHHEEKIFTSLEDELAFHTNMGWTEQLRNPATGTYRWEKDEVLAAIQSGEAHAFRLVGGFFGGRKMDAAYRIHDEDLAARVRAETLRGFGLQPA